jgi:hypothetical protein
MGCWINQHYVVSMPTLHQSLLVGRLDECIHPSGEGIQEVAMGQITGNTLCAVFTPDNVFYGLNSQYILEFRVDTSSFTKWSHPCNLDQEGHAWEYLAVSSKYLYLAQRSQQLKCYHICVIDRITREPIETFYVTVPGYACQMAASNTHVAIRLASGAPCQVAVYRRGRCTPVYQVTNKLGPCSHLAMNDSQLAVFLKDRLRVVRFLVCSGKNLQK